MKQSIKLNATKRPPILGSLRVIDRICFDGRVIDKKILSKNLSYRNTHQTNSIAVRSTVSGLAINCARFFKKAVMQSTFMPINELCGYCSDQTRKLKRKSIVFMRVWFLWMRRRRVVSAGLHVVSIGESKVVSLNLYLVFLGLWLNDAVHNLRYTTGLERTSLPSVARKKKGKSCLKYIPT